MTDLSVQIASLTLKNPVLTASGTFGYGTEYMPYFDVNQLGGIITKTVTLEAREGNPLPRIAETPAGMLNSIGLANVGMKRFIEEKLSDLESLTTAVIVNIAGNTMDEYRKAAAQIQKHRRVDAIEVNISCPNVERGGLAFGSDEDITNQVTQKVRAETEKVIIVKLTPNVTDICSIAKAAADGGADALSLINTVLGMGVDVKTGKPLIGRIVGGLSGPAIKPIALAKVYQVSQSVSIPVIGLGGIMSGHDAVEFMMAGAAAVQVGTLSFVDPSGALRVLHELEAYCEENKIKQVSSLTGSMEKPK